ncbi:uncharacterized protein LOC122514990 [Polistes fuscatus]|uniref:uncharacterized protein LOC122514990 n=1 Tax=Polistes fuscatus TaxID=30207 RepID=UPI001CA867DD|nr:uncharacterized protein LOC122514990 [Polistes fuscatus]
MLGRLMDQLTQSTQPAAATAVGTRTRSRLPELTVPSFSGDIRKWPDFKAMFVSVIGNRTDLSDLEKFQYLKAAMQGDASELIINLRPDHSSYAAAWSMLNNRFENKRLIIKSHLERLLNLKPMQKRQSSSLTKLLNIINETTQALKHANTNECLMVTLVSGLLDRDTREKWETSLTSSDEFPSLSKLTEFLLARACTLENMEENATHTTAQLNAAKTTVPRRVVAHQASQQSRANSPKPATQTSQQAAQSTQPRSTYPCDCCGQDHYIVMCPKWRDYSISQRLRVVKERSLCWNYLGRHNVRNCHIHRHCRNCNGLHHTMFHSADISSLFSTPSDRTQTAPGDQATAGPSGRNFQRTPHSHPTLLAIATATVFSPTSSSQVCVLIDPGSEISFISEGLTRQLHLERRHSTLDVYGVGGKRTSQTSGVVTIDLHSRYRPLSVRITAHVLKTVTGILPSGEISQEPEWPHLRGLNLADPEFLTPRAEDVIIGADFYGQLIRPNIIRHSSRDPIAQLSIFGWLVIGPTRAPVTLARKIHHGISQPTNSCLQNLLTKFWIQEEVPTATNVQLTPEELECEHHFKTTNARDLTGRYIVRIPLNSSPKLLGDSQHTAHACLQRTLTRFRRDHQYQQRYTQFMREYEESGHMTKLDDNSTVRRPHYYLPHHGVLKPDSSTTKLRVVFNGSSTTSTGYSLNDLMHAGPNLMLNLFDLLIWIRRRKYLFATNITKMYRQIKIHSDDWDLQRILWVDEQLKKSHFQLTTVTYGTKSAPFLAVRTLLQLVADEGSSYPLAVEPITHGRYVDDIFGGADSVGELIQTAHQLIRLCHAGGFPLAKWHSTSSQLLAELPSESGKDSDISFDGCAGLFDSRYPSAIIVEILKRLRRDLQELSVTYSQSRSISQTTQYFIVKIEERKMWISSMKLPTLWTLIALSKKFSTLCESDRRTACYVTNKVHGIPFRDFCPEKYEKNHVHLELNKFRQRHGSKLLIAYKGGHIERDLLIQASITGFNLEDFDCPKYEDLIKIYDDSKFRNCYLHTSAKSTQPVHCPVVETLVYREWK